MSDVEVDLAMPRFSVEASFSDSLQAALQSMGVRRIFSDMAQLDNVSPGISLRVSQMTQRARIDVTEEGTEAAAATIIIGEKTGIVRHATFTANRPFLYYITDRATGLIVFIGIYNG